MRERERERERGRERERERERERRNMCMYLHAMSVAKFVFVSSKFALTCALFDEMLQLVHAIRGVRVVQLVAHLCEQLQLRLEAFVGAFLKKKKRKKKQIIER